VTTRTIRIEVDCPCCRGETRFNWYDDACDECALGIFEGRYPHGHPLSERQIEANFIGGES
jgi:hypothetical protein